jgi:hypothetical protein
VVADLDEKITRAGYAAKFSRLVRPDACDCTRAARDALHFRDIGPGGRYDR